MTRTSKSAKSSSRGLRIAIVVLLILIAAAGITLASKWPFTRAATVTSLEEISATDVAIGRMHMSFFPHPGYVAEDVTFRRDSALNRRPLGRMTKIVCRGSWLDLLSFTHRIPRMDLEGAQFYIPAHVPSPIRKHPPSKMGTTVTELFSNGAVLEIAPRHEGSGLVRFDFPELALTNLGKGKAIRFRTLMVNTGLIGRLSVTGTVGPLLLGKLASTHIAGDYRLTDVDLSTHKQIAGTLSANGHFQGTLGGAEVTGHTDIRSFELTSSRHSLALIGEYHSLVDGIKGNVTIQSAEVRFLRSTLIAHGGIEGNQGKTLSVEIDSRKARIEDLLWLFVKADQPALKGALTLHAQVVLPPKQESFLKRVHLDGKFAIDDAEFTNDKTEQKVAELSARALGKKRAKGGDVSEIVTAELKSKVKLHNGVATLSEAVFAVPGALARGAGTFDVSNQTVDLRGDLAMRVTLSKAAGGMKSVLLIPLDPLFKKDEAGAVLPIRITGRYPNPVFKLSLTK